MSPKRLFIIGFFAILLVNGSIFGTLYVVDLMAGPTPEELAALRKAEEDAALQAIYDKLPPLEEFTSKANYIKSIGEAIDICENKLHDSVKGQKSWEVNMIESRYLPERELYKIFIDYETVAKFDKPSERFKASCEVQGSDKMIALWKADPR